MRIEPLRLGPEWHSLIYRWADGIRVSLFVVIADTINNCGEWKPSQITGNSCFQSSIADPLLSNRTEAAYRTPIICTPIIYSIQRIQRLIGPYRFIKFAIVFTEQQIYLAAHLLSNAFTDQRIYLATHLLGNTFTEQRRWVFGCFWPGKRRMLRYCWAKCTTAVIIMQLISG